MIENLLSPLIHFVTYLVSTFSYFGVFIAMAIESAGIPLPSEVIMPFSGFMVSQGAFNFYLVVLVGALGNLAGSLIAYFIGLWAEESGIRGVIKNYGKWVLLSIEDYDLAEKWFRKHGEIIILISRVLPVVRTYISFPAGAAKVSLVRFCVLTFAGSLLWSFILNEIGVKLGENWQKIGPYFHQFDLAIVIAVVALVGFFVYHKIRKVRTNGA